MADIQELLTKKIGPLPGFAWVALVGGGLAYVWWANRDGAPTEPAIATGTDTATGETQAPLQVSGYGTLVPAATTVVPTTPVTNEEWVTVALEAMALAQPFLDTAAAEAALRAYITGTRLTTSQVAYVTLARALVGAPPLPLPVPPAGLPPPTTSPKLAAPTGLHLRERSPHRLNIAWNKVSGAANYTVYLNGSARTNTPGTSTILGSVTPLHPGTTYRVQVRARGVAGTSPLSPIVRMTTSKG